MSTLHSLAVITLALAAIFVPQVLAIYLNERKLAYQNPSPLNSHEGNHRAGPPSSFSLPWRSPCPRALLQPAGESVEKKSTSRRSLRRSNHVLSPDRHHCTCSVPHLL